MNIRVYELAKKLGISSKELAAKLKDLKVEVKGHMSAIDAETAEIIEAELKGTAKAAPSAMAGVPSPAEPQLPVLKVDMPLTVKDFAVKLQVKSGDLIKRLMKHKILASINQSLNEDVLKMIGKEFGYLIEKTPTPEESLLEVHYQKADTSKLVPRPPVVTLMGHVDHGKTSLLDAIRQTNITDREAGGITQHIGAYEVTLSNRKITFLDTPGHEAFTAMRARGANVTDIVVLVVAADDGVMPQTIEAIDHAKAAGVSIIVSINKVDKPNANIDMVKKQLMGLGLTPEDWGGKTITVNVSAKTRQGIDTLLEMLLLEAETLELKADPTRPASGIVIESRLSKGGGPAATVLIKNGTLKVGDVVVSGLYYGRIKAMLNDKGIRVREAGPSVPVEIYGLSGVPQAGQQMFVVEDEKKARELSESKISQKREAGLGGSFTRITLEDLFQRIKEGSVKELNLIIKSDVQGSMEALTQSLEKLSTNEVKLKVIHNGVGNINESDIMLAAASNAIVIGFHVDLEPNADILAKEENVDVRIYHIIYEAIGDVRAAMEGLLEPQKKETFLGRAEILKVFTMSKGSVVAGCKILKGKITRGAMARVLRGGSITHEGRIESLRHEKEDIKAAEAGLECGILLSGFKGFETGDIIEAFQVEMMERKL